MDKDEARFILRSFRPDGADAGDPDFAEALRIAAEDRAIGEWLADERSLDSRFSTALGSVAAPSGLRDRILMAAGTDAGGIPQAESELDARMIGAMASVQVPAGMRCQLLTAMAKSRGGRARRSWWWNAAWPTAAAAGIALALYFTGRGVAPIATGAPLATISTNEVQPDGTVPVDVVQASFIRTFESPIFIVDEHPAKHEQLMQILEEKKLPCPKCLPPGLVGVEGLGCRELEINGKKGSLVCFDDPENGRVHLVIFKREDVCGDLPPRDRPEIRQCGPWAVARWVDQNHVFVLLGSRPMDKLAALF